MSNILSQEHAFDRANRVQYDYNLNLSQHTQYNKLIDEIESVKGQGHQSIICVHNVFTSHK